MIDNRLNEALATISSQPNILPKYSVLRPRLKLKRFDAPENSPMKMKDTNTAFLHYYCADSGLVALFQRNYKLN